MKIYKKYSLLVLSVLCTMLAIAQEQDKKIDLIIDADTANEIDDLFAIVRAIGEPKFNLLGVTSAQFHTSPLATDNTVYESQQINEAILQLMKQETIALPLGSNTALKDAKTPSVSAASRFIIEKAHQMPKNKQLHIAILGSCTNVASAIIEDATIIPKLSLHYIGFWHNIEKNTYDKAEFNTRNDSIATNLLLNTKGLNFNVMTATTSQHLVFKKEDADRKKLFVTPPENTKRTIGIHTWINAEKMTADFWKSLKNI